MKKYSLLILVAALAVALLAISGCSAATPATPAASSGAASSSGGASSASVSISNFAFDPADLTVKVGQTVTWTNNDSVGHTVTSDTGVFKSDSLAQSATFSYTFTKAGTYPYHCSVHPQMVAKVTVQ